jgi:hypothetical protein
MYQSVLLISLILCSSFLISAGLWTANGTSFSVKKSAEATTENNPIFNITKAHEYLANRYNPHYGLVRENEITDKYWLWSDNILAALALKDYNYSLYANITNTLRNFTQYHNIGFRSAWAALTDPTSIDQSSSFKSPINKNVTHDIWYTDYNGSAELRCSDYADIAFLKSIYFYEINKIDQSKACYDEGTAMFDGIGFKDKAFISDGFKYSTYKIALWKVASNITGFSGSNKASQVILKIQNMIIERAQNQITGGEYTHYSTNLIPGNETNVETTSIAIIASKGVALPRMAGEGE